MRPLKGAMSAEKRLKGPRRSRGSCREERKRIVFPRRGVIILPARQVNEFFLQKGNRKTIPDQTCGSAQLQSGVPVQSVLRSHEVKVRPKPRWKCQVFNRFNNFKKVFGALTLLNLGSGQSIVEFQKILEYVRKRKRIELSIKSLSWSKQAKLSKTFFTTSRERN